VKRPVPKVTVQRLPLYLRCLESLPDTQIRVSSDELATMAGVNPAKVRKDLSYLGTFGVRGVGYDVEHLRFQIRTELGLERDWHVVIVGVGNLGRALANYAGFGDRGFRVVGLFDSSDRKIGSRIAGVEIESLDTLADAIRDRAATIGVITTPEGSAQEVADALMDAGITSILNFAPTVIKARGGVEVRRVDLSTELQVLSFYLHQQLSD
jgi:redox-sensing transcriptional repressor